ncbi:MAG: hypothetical protein DRH23_16210 [Deltaproteobacteria bacterium]|nr:MAG: hypothetical protein DRH23_16210 [Deltaproteobacteria bacterium]
MHHEHAAFLDGVRYIDGKRLPDASWESLEPGGIGAQGDISAKGIAVGIALTSDLHLVIAAGVRDPDGASRRAIGVQGHDRCTFDGAVVGAVEDVAPQNDRSEARRAPIDHFLAHETFVAPGLGDWVTSIAVAARAARYKRQHECRCANHPFH